MKHHGLKIEANARAKGFDIKGVAEKIGVSRVQVENDLKMEKLTRRRLQKYVPYFVPDLESFYNENDVPPKETEVSIYLPKDLQAALVHKEDLIAAKDEIIREQRKHIETLSNMLRFFPSAVQQAIITA